MTVHSADAEELDLLTVALVDDEPAQHVMMAMAIENVGLAAALVSFASGEGLLEHLDNAHVKPFAPDIIVLDLRMPGLGGYGTLERLQAHPDHWKIPVIVFTSSDRPAERSMSLERGARLFQPKPSELGRLESLVRGFPILAVNTKSETGNQPTSLAPDRSFLSRIATD